MKLTIGAGLTEPLAVGGGRFYYESGTGKIRVRTIGNDPADFELSPGMGFQNRPDQINFFGIEITNLEDSEQEIEFIVSYREVFDNRVTFGANGGSVPVVVQGQAEPDVVISYNITTVGASQMEFTGVMQRKKLMLSVIGSEWSVGETNDETQHYRKFSSGDDFEIDSNGTFWVHRYGTSTLYSIEILLP